MVVVGQIVFELCMLVCVGFLKVNGIFVNCVDYLVLWVYVQVSGMLVLDDEWSKVCWGCFFIGDGLMMFCFLELCGEFIWCWDDGCSIDKDCVIGLG